MLVPNRNFSSPEYRYGFQGQEKDDEVKGSGNSINYKYRMHDPRVGRFFAVDPLTAKYPHYTPYQFSGNKVIHMVELEGLEEADPKRGKSNTRSEGEESCGKVYSCGTEEFEEGWYSITDYEKVSNTNRTVTHYYSQSDGSTQQASMGAMALSVSSTVPKAVASAESDGPVVIVGDIIGLMMILNAVIPDIGTTTYTPTLDGPDSDSDKTITFYRGILAPRADETVYAQDFSASMNGRIQLNMTQGLYMTTNPTQAAIWAKINDLSGTGRIVGYKVVAITIKKKVWETFKLSNPSIIERQVLQPPMNKSDLWEETVIPTTSISTFSKLGVIYPVTPAFGN